MATKDLWSYALIVALSLSLATLIIFFPYDIWPLGQLQ